MFTLTGRGDPEQLVGLHASATLLPALGLEPMLGRNFSADEDRPGGERVALVSHRLWQRRFNGDRSILGQALMLNGAPYTVIGVLSEAASAFPLNQIQIWVPRPAEVPYVAPSQLRCEASERPTPGACRGGSPGLMCTTSARIAEPLE